MANPRQRRKARSASSLKPSLNAKRQMKKKLARAPTVHGAEVLKQAYDPKLTLRQNYAKLGLVASLDVRPNSGGTESTSTSASASTTLSAKSGEERVKVRKGMARVVRDDAGNIVDIIEAEADADVEEVTPWGKPLADSVADSEQVETFMPERTLEHQPKGAKHSQVVTELEQRAAQAAPVERHTSQLESQWLADLVAKYDSDTEAMARDRTLNVWQKTPGEIKRAIKKAGGLAAFHTS